MIFCPKCGEAIPEDSITCPKCGTNMSSKNDEPAIIYASQKKTEESATGDSKKIPTLSKKQKSIAAVVILLIAYFIVSNEIGKANLKKELLRDWEAPESSVMRVLDFSDDKIEYSVETGISWLNTTIAKMDYKVTSRKTIKVDMIGNGKYTTHTISFNANKTKMVVKPALTSVESEEEWYNFDND